MLRAGVSTACLYPRVVEEALYDLALSGVSNVEIFINSHSELRRSFVDTMGTPAASVRHDLCLAAPVHL